MSDANVARRYAEALIDVAAEAGRVDRVADDLHEIDQALQAHGGLLNGALASPVFAPEEREAVLMAIMPRLDLDVLTQNFLRVLGRNRRFGAFSAIRAAYEDLADARSGRVRVKVTTAEPLTPQLELEIKAALEASTGKSVIIDHLIDSSLIAGMVARIGGTVYDSSLRTRLQQLQHHLVVAQA